MAVRMIQYQQLAQPVFVSAGGPPQTFEPDVLTITITALGVGTVSRGYRVRDKMPLLRSPHPNTVRKGTLV